MITVAFVSAEMIPAIYEMALKHSPNNEELHSHLFMAYVRIGEYKKQQQVVASWVTSSGSCLENQLVAFFHAVVGTHQILSK